MVSLAEINLFRRNLPMNYLEKSLTLRVSECDLNGRWRPGAALTELQEIAGEHSVSLGCGREALLRGGLVWVVARMELRILRYPRWGEALTLRTFHRPVRHRFFPRFFQVFDSGNQPVLLASSLWLLMDLETRRSVSADLLPMPLPDNGDAPEPLPLPGAILPLDAPETAVPFAAVYTDLDVNGHVNNTRYVDWLCNALGVETMTDRPPCAMTVHFNSEICPGLPVDLRLRQSGSRFLLSGLHDGRSAFEIGGELSDQLT